MFYTPITININDFKKQSFIINKMSREKLELAELGFD